MKRRNFLRGLLTIAGTAVVAPAVLADPDRADWLQGQGQIWQVKTKIAKPHLYQRGRYAPPGVYTRTVFDGGQPNKNGDIFRTKSNFKPGDTISHEDLAKLNRAMADLDPPLLEIDTSRFHHCEKTLSPEDLAEIAQILDQPWHKRRAAATGFEQQVYDAVDLLAQF